MSLARADPERVYARAPGKINLSFAVGPLGADGYHEVASVYQAVSLYEDLVASHAETFHAVVTGGVDVSGVPLGDDNLAVRAARLVADEVGWTGGIRLEIHKNVPVAGGMGGGSADAAAALVAVDALVESGLSAAQLHELARSLGADVPFALTGGTAVGTGRGDLLAPALVRGRFFWVLVPSEEGLSTPEVYRELDRLRGHEATRVGAPAVDAAVLRALRAGDAAALAPALRNDLQEAALSLRPDLAAVVDAGMDRGALAGIVSGSGPTVALLVTDADAAMRLSDALEVAGIPSLVAGSPERGAHVTLIE